MRDVYVVMLSEKCRAQNFTQDKVTIMHEMCAEIFPNFVTFIIFIIFLEKIFFK